MFGSTWNTVGRSELLRCAVRCSSDVGPPSGQGLLHAGPGVFPPHGQPVFHVEPGRAYAQGLGALPRPPEYRKAHNPNELVMSRRHSTKDPELETASPASPAAVATEC